MLSSFPASYDDGTFEVGATCCLQPPNHRTNIFETTDYAVYTVQTREGGQARSGCEACNGRKFSSELDHVNGFARRIGSLRIMPIFQEEGRIGVQERWTWGIIWCYGAVRLITSGRRRTAAAAAAAATYGLVVPALLPPSPFLPSDHGGKEHPRRTGRTHSEDRFLQPSDFL